MLWVRITFCLLSGQQKIIFVVCVTWLDFTLRKGFHMRGFEGIHLNTLVSWSAGHTCARALFSRFVCGSVINYHFELQKRIILCRHKFSQFVAVLFMYTKQIDYLLRFLEQEKKTTHIEDVRLRILRSFC